MSLSDMISAGGISMLVILSLIQIAPIEVNPWAAIGRFFGRAINGEVIARMDKEEAKTARYRIIRFDDEIRHGIRHTEEHFNQILDDIHEYEVYCAKHKDFPNGKAVSAVKKIKEVYEKCKDEQSFL